MTSRLQQIQQSFQKKQMEEREKQLINLYAKNQQRALQRVGKSDNGISNGLGQRTSFGKSINNSYSSSKKSSPGIDKSRPLAPLNTNGAMDRPTIRITQPTPKVGVLSERQKAREAMKKKEAELLEKIKQQKAELDRVKPRKSINMVNENNERNKPQLKFNSRISQPPSEKKKEPAPKPKFSMTSKLKQASKKVDPNLASCNICGRSFAKDRIDKHISICEKTSQKKRKTFDVTKMRTKGTDAEKYVKRGLHKKPDPPKKSTWRKQHEEFIRSVNDAKKFSQHIAAGGKASDLPPPRPSDNSDYIQCPHCERKFSERAAERHIPKCENISSNKKQPPKNQWNSTTKKTNQFKSRRY